METLAFYPERVSFSAFGFPKGVPFLSQIKLGTDSVEVQGRPPRTPRVSAVFLSAEVTIRL